MLPMKGPATLTFDDGTTFEVTADIVFRELRGVTSGNGKIVSQNIFAIGMMPGQPILDCGGRKYRVVVTQARSDGSGTVTTSGGPIP